MITGWEVLGQGVFEHAWYIEWTKNLQHNVHRSLLVSWEKSRSKAAAQVAAEHAEGRKARKRQDKDDVKVRRIRAKIGETSLIKSRNDLVATQLQLYNINKSSFVAAMGQEAYDYINKIIELLNKLLNPDKVPIGCAADDNDKEEDDDNDDASDA